MLVEKNIYSPEMCPFLLKNSRIRALWIQKMNSSLIRTSILGFQDLKPTDNTIKSIKSKIDYLAAHFIMLRTLSCCALYHAALNSKFLNALLFENINILDINCPVGYSRRLV